VPLGMIFPMIKSILIPHLDVKIPTLAVNTVIIHRILLIIVVGGQPMSRMELGIIDTTPPRIMAGMERVVGITTNAKH